MGKIRVGGFRPHSVADGTGIRCVVFFQGCNRGCDECHNLELQTMDGGQEMCIDELVDKICAVKYIKGVTLSGGEPFLQPDALIELTKKLKERGMNIWAYSGFMYMELIKFEKDVLANIDVLVDGPFVKELSEGDDHPFRGSANQLIVDVPKSRETGDIVLYDLNSQTNN